MTTNHKKFKEVLLLNSTTQDYQSAIKEWKLLYSYKEDNHCICGHSIVKNCIIQNINNKNRLVVGSTCIKKFLNIDSDFNVVSIINKHYDTQLLNYMISHQVINQVEYDFINNLPKYKRVSEKQEKWFYSIHKKVSLYWNK